ncbi:PIF1-like helicase-domain-containing protein [Mycena sp. CBHHK59/15]|nr:PIF1-like helicase-domain-containing protein [Mycena sp. CBHHK59/15]
MEPVVVPATPLQPAQTIKLSNEQQKVLDMVLEGKSVFFTGPAGTGKSILLREIIRTLRADVGGSSLAITASTGIAGLNIGGSTVHSFAGIGLGKESKERLAEKIKYSFRLRLRWEQTKTLIIDESMQNFTLLPPSHIPSSIYDRRYSLRQTRIYSPRGTKISRAFRRHSGFYLSFV